MKTIRLVLGLREGEEMMSASYAGTHRQAMNWGTVFLARFRLLELSALLILASCGRYAVPGDGLAESLSQGCFPPPSGLVAWYTGDTDGKDHARGHDGTLVGSARIAPGQVAGAFQLDGQAGGVQIPSNGDVNFGSGQDFTIEAWVSVNVAVTSREYLAVFGKLDASGRGYSFFLGPPGQIGLQLANSSQVFDNHFASAPSARDGQFHHVAVTVDRNTGVRFYVDGIPAETGPQSFGQITDVASEADLFLGRHWRNLNYSLAGLLDEVSVYNRVLLPTEIASIYQAGTAGKCQTSVVDGTIGSIGGTAGSEALRITADGVEPVEPYTLCAQSICVTGGMTP